MNEDLFIGRQGHADGGGSSFYDGLRWVEIRDNGDGGIVEFIDNDGNDASMGDPANVAEIALRSTRRPPATPTSSEAPIAHRAKTAAGKNGNGAAPDISPSDRKILDALGTFLSFGMPEVDPVSLAVLAGYRPGGGRFNNLKSGLRARGLIEYIGGAVRLTAQGKKVSNGREFTRLDELHSAWFEVLDPSQQKLLTPLLREWPRPISFDFLATLAGYTPGAGRFNNLRSSLKTLGAIEYPAPGQARAADILFPAGLI